jgi:hypothetical protein
MPTTFTFQKKSGAPSGTINIVVGPNTFLLDDSSHTTFTTTDPAVARDLVGNPFVQIQGTSASAYSLPPVNTPNVQSGTTYTFATTDAGGVVEFTSATAVTATIPANSAEPFGIGSEIKVHQNGAGQVTFSPAAGVTLRGYSGKTKIAGQYGTVKLRKRATDEWVLEQSGDAA